MNRQQRVRSQAFATDDAHSCAAMTVKVLRFLSECASYTPSRRCAWACRPKLLHHTNNDLTVVAYTTMLGGQELSRLTMPTAELQQANPKY